MKNKKLKKLRLMHPTTHKEWNVCPNKNWSPSKNIEVVKELPRDWYDPEEDAEYENYLTEEERKTYLRNHTE